MMFSILPVLPSDSTGVAASKTIDFKVKSVPFAPLTDIGKPIQPTASSNPVDNAIYFSMSGAVVGLTVVASALF